MERPIGLIREASDGNQYQWLGGQWAKYSTKTKKASQIAKKDIARELNSLDINLETEKKASLKAFENKMLGTSETEKNQFDIAKSASKQVDAEQAMVQKMLNTEAANQPTLSDKTKETVGGLKRNFSAQNMAKMATQEMRQTPEIVKKIMGEDYKDPLAKPVSAKATKIEKLDSDNEVVSILSKMLDFMQKSYDEDKLHRERESNLAESEANDKKRKEEEFLKTLDALKGGGKSGAMASDSAGDTEDENGGGKDAKGKGKDAKGKGKDAKGKSKGRGKKDISKDLKKLGKNDISKDLKKLGKNDKALKSATKVSKIASSAKGLLKFLKVVPGLAVIAGAGVLIAGIADAIQQHEDDEISDMQLKKQIVEALGGAIGGAGGAVLGASLGAALGSVVPGAGTILGGLVGAVGGAFIGEEGGKKIAEKAFSYFTEDKETKPNQKMELPEGVKPSTAGAGQGSASFKDPRLVGGGGEADPMKQAEDGSNGAAGASGSSATAVSSEGQSGSMGASGSAGESGSSGSSGSAGKSGSSGSSGSAGESGSSGSSGSAGASGSSASGMPTASPMPPTSPMPESLMASVTPTAPEPASSSASPASMPNIGQMMSSITNENMDTKLDEKSMAGMMSSVFNNTTNSTSQKASGEKSPLPSVRNQEPTFQKMIYNNTRVI
jgi:hypothetical protein